MAKELDITLRLKRDKAKADAEAFRRDMAGVQQQMARDAVAAARQGSEETVKLYRDAHGKLRQENGRFATDAQKAAAGATDSYNRVALAVGGITAGLAVARTLAGGIADAASKSAADLQRVADTFARLRDMERERAAATGGQATGRAALETLRFARASAMTPEEAQRFRTQFANEGQAYAGNLSPEDFKKYQQQSALLATRAGADADVAARFASQFITQQTTADKATADQFRVAEIYGAGAGTASENYNAFARLRSQFVPGKLAPFRSNEELATVGSVANALGAGRQEESVADLVRALRDPSNKKLQELYKQVGLPQNASVMETIQGIAPALLQQSQAQGIGLDQVLAGYIADAQPRRSLAAQVSLGVGAGQYRQRAGVVARAGAEGAVGQAMGEFLAQPNTLERQASTDVALAEAEKAARSEDLNVVRKQALAALIQRGEINTTATGVNDFLNRGASFGLVGDAQRKRIDDETQAIITQRARTRGVPLRRDFMNGILNVSPEAREDELNRLLLQFRQRGVDPLQRDIFEGASRRAEQQSDAAAGAIPGSGLVASLLGKIASNTTPKEGTAPRPLLPRPAVQNR